MKARFSFVLVAAAFALSMISIPGCPYLFPTPTPSPTRVATAPIGNAFQIVPGLGAFVPR